VLEFTKLTIRNFLSYSDYKTVIPLANLGVIRLEGNNLDNPSAASNMSGKSAILDALSWVLWKKTLRGLKGNAIVHRARKRDCAVSLLFSRGDASYEVRRYCSHAKYGNSLHLYRDSVPLHSRHLDRTQQVLEEILGLSYAQFCHCVIFGGTRPFSSLSDGDQKRVLESFLHFEEVDKALQRTRTRLRLVQQQLQETEMAYVDSIGRCRTLQSVLRLHQRNLRVALSQAHKAAKRSARGLQEATHKLRRCRLRVRHGRERLHVSARAFQQVSRELEEASTEWMTLRKEKSSLSSKLQGCTSRSVTQHCRLCGQKITVESRRKYRLRLEKELSFLSAKIPAIKRWLEDSQEKANHLQRKLDRLRQSVARGQAKAESLLEQIRKLRQSTKEIPSTFPLEQDLEIAGRKYTRAVAQKIRVQRKRESLRKQTRDLEFWETGFGNRGIKSIIVREALPSLNAKLREFANAIFEEPVELEFRPSRETKSGEERESFYVHYSNPRGGESYLAESAGGRKRVDVAVLLAFNWLSRASNLLFIDELLDGLDRTGREKVLEILSTLRGTVFVISHRKDVQSQVGRVWTITKQDGCSRLELK